MAAPPPPPLRLLPSPRRRSSNPHHIGSLMENPPSQTPRVHALHLTVILLLLLDLSSSLLSCSYHDKNKGENKLYHWGAVAILSLLSARILALTVALGSSFFVRLGFVIDGLVVVGALVLEVVAQGRGAGLLVVASLWRVMRVVDSTFEFSDELPLRPRSRM